VHDRDDVSAVAAAHLQHGYRCGTATIGRTDPVRTDGRTWNVKDLTVVC
jgi:hypothetical protein